MSYLVNFKSALKEGQRVLHRVKKERNKGLLRFESKNQHRAAKAKKTNRAIFLILLQLIIFFLLA